MRTLKSFFLFLLVLVTFSLYLLGMKVEKKIFCPCLSHFYILCFVCVSEVLFSLDLYNLYAVKMLCILFALKCVVVTLAIKSSHCKWLHSWTRNSYQLSPCLVVRWCDWEGQVGVGSPA